MNVDLLNRVKQVILEEPRRLDMSVYVSAPDDWWDEDDKPPCGTTACIAGWAVLLSDYGEPGEIDELPDEDFVEDRARELLDLNSAQAWVLFHRQNWPTQFSAAHILGNWQTKAEVTAARIDTFIATNGEE